MELKYIQAISHQHNISIKQITEVIKMHTEGATIPFMARYRKEATDNLDEVQIANIVDGYIQFDTLIKRKETILKTIEAAGKLDEALKKRIDDCISTTELEDIYLPYKPKRRTKAMMAIEKGLEPLAVALVDFLIQDPLAEAEKYITDDVKTVEDALQGARDIIAEKVAEHELARSSIRKLFTEEAVISSKIISSKKDEADAQTYRDYFEFNEPLHKIPSHRLLAIRRGEKAEFLLMNIDVEKAKALEKLENIFIYNHENKSKASGAAKQEIVTAIEDGYTRLLKNQIETESRMVSKTQADEEAIVVFAENLRQLLMEAPLGAKRIMALDPGFRSGCKLACIDEQGAFLYYTTIFPHAPQSDAHGSQQTILHLVNKYGIEAIGYGNGTASRETETLLNGITFEKPVQIFMVNESGASIYSASDVAREEFPNEDLTVRGAISIGRRLLDPLSELVKIDAKSIGVGQYQHDVNQTRLKDMLDNVVISCVNQVGVDVNTASKHLLMYVSGLSANLSKNIVAYRDENGAFKNRESLKKVPLMGPKSFEQCAGFLRIPNAENPLDNSSVHPERYELVAKMAKSIGADVKALMTKSELQKNINAKQFVDDTVGIYTIEDIIKELEKPGRDPRGVLEAFSFDASIKTMEDVKIGMQYPGIITNITKFGAFVNIGVKQDGMVHISHIANKYINDPNEVVKLNQKVMVTALEVDVARKRISLSMKDATEMPAKNSGPRPQKFAAKLAQKEEPILDFNAGLAALQNKFGGRK
jgi:protein Tex